MDQINLQTSTLQIGAAKGLTIRSVTTEIVDIPIRRAHEFSKKRITTQAYLVVEILTEEGPVGLGEGATPGGPWWSGDSIETMKLMIDRYLAPVLVGQEASQVGRLHDRMNRVAAANPFAKAAVDVALWDLLGKALDAPVHALFGGAVRDRSEISWALATGVLEADIAEAEAMIDGKQARVFKLKSGAKTPEEDARHAIAVANALAGRADVRIDLNQVWDEMTARRWFPAFVDSALTLVEQPIQSWNIEGMARLRAQFNIPIMADESVTTLQSAMALAGCAGADVIAYKVMKSGGLTACRQIAGIAEAAGIACFGGTFLDSSIGASAGLQVAAAERSVTFGSEYIGGLWLSDEIVEQPLVYEDFHVVIPQRPGLGMVLDRGKLSRYRRE